MDSWFFWTLFACYVKLNGKWKLLLCKYTQQQTNRVYRGDRDQFYYINKYPSFLSFCYLTNSYLLFVFFCSCSFPCMLIIKKRPTIWDSTMSRNEFWHLSYRNEINRCILLMNQWTDHTVIQCQYHRRTFTKESWYQCWNRNMAR